MGNMDGEMDSEGNACVQTLPDTNSMSLLLNYGIICPSVPYYQGLKGWERGTGVLILPSCIPYYFITFSLPAPTPPLPPQVWGLGRHMTFQTRVLSFISKVHSLKQD